MIVGVCICGDVVDVIKSASKNVNVAYSQRVLASADRAFVVVVLIIKI